MCGIAGIVDLKGMFVSPRLLEAMVDSISHRGPDCTSTESGPSMGALGFGHARLSIIDLAGGQQPMPNSDKTLWITFNGEIFNYIELRQELMEKGYRFATQSDTEVVLRMYEDQGEDCVRHFNGQWAFAIWDSKRNKLFLSRDRAGVRPIYYARTPGSVVFGSEIKALLTHPEVDRTLDMQSLDQVFTFWCPLAPRTMFKGIQELPPGHSMTLEGDTLHVWKYWGLDYSSINYAMKEEYAADRLLELLTDATRVRLRSDVPVGAYLSGGLDSSVIVALIRQMSSSRLKTFSVSFEDAEYDERPYQDAVVDLWGTEHRTLNCSYDDISRVFPDVVWHAEKPILRTAPAPLFLLSGLVREDGYKVVLTGEGADEFLGGYDIFKEAKVRRFCAANPTSAFRPLLLKRLYPYIRNLQSQSGDYLKAFFHADPALLADPFFSHMPRWEQSARLKLFLSAAVKCELQKSDTYSELRAALPFEYRQWDPLSQAQYLEATTLLPGYILSAQGDRMAMAHSVEGRFPFLDYRVVEFASTIPPAMRIKVLQEKHLLKRAAGHLVPPSVRERPKQPYRAPEIHSFFDSKLQRSRQEYVDELLSPERIRRNGVFDPVAVGKLVEKSRKGQTIGVKDNMALVGILSTELFLEQFINNKRGHIAVRNRERPETVHSR